MKNVEKNKANKKRKSTNKSIAKPKKQQVLVVAQELKFARLLAGNEQKTRDRALKSLKKWLLNCFQKEYEFKEDDFSRIWKGLFYAVWMSDKPLVQEELCEWISSLLDLFPPERLSAALLLVHAGLRTLATEWYGLDSHRLDKFLMLVRRYLRASLRCVARCGWAAGACEQYGAMLGPGVREGRPGLLATATPDYARNAASLQTHVVECFLEEVAKVSEGSIPPPSLASLLSPFVRYMCLGPVEAVAAACRRLLTQLLRQSDTAQREDHRIRAWEKMGCPAGGPEALELVSDDEGEEEGEGSGEEEESAESVRPLDPRAGRVHVELAGLAVPAGELAGELAALLPRLSSRAHRRATVCMRRFEALSRSQYPFEPPSPGEASPRAVNVTVSAAKLRARERALVAQADELSLRGLSRKHRKRLLAKSRAGLSIVEDVPTAGTARGTASREPNTENGWLIEETEPTPKKEKKQGANKENDIQKKQKKRQRMEKQNGDGTKRRKIDQPETTKNKQDDKMFGKKLKNDSNIEKMDVTNAVKAESKPSNSVKSPMKLSNGVKSPIKMSNSVTKNKEKSKNIGLNSTKEANKTPNKSLTEKTQNKILGNKQKNAENKQKIPQPKQKVSPPSVVAKKVKSFQKQLSPKQSPKADKIVGKLSDTPKKVKFVLKNNSMQGPVDYFRSVRQSPSIPFDSSKKPVKTNLKPSTPSPINPFFKKKMKLTKLNKL